MSTKDGGPAFPVDLYEDDPSDPSCPPQVLKSTGMSLRDWFAGQALAGIASDMEGMVASSIADQAYIVADAMIAARTPGGPTE